MPDHDDDRVSIWRYVFFAVVLVAYPFVRFPIWRRKRQLARQND